ncbi:MAG: FAD-dependent oxidoreductase, partial [bacterium]
MAERVLIVGGGAAGCFLAAILAEKGKPVVLIERASRLGGRASSMRDPRTGDLLEIGPHLIMGCYESTHRFAHLVQASDILTFQDKLNIPFQVDSDTTARFSCPSLPAPLHVGAALLRFSHLPLKDRLSGLRIGPELLSRRWCSTEHLDEETAQDWLTRCGQTPALCRLLWSPLCDAVLNFPLDRGSAKLFANVLVAAFCRSQSASRLGWAIGGLGTLCDTHARRFIQSNGGQILIRTRVRSLLVEDGRIAGVKTTSGESITGNAVVSTLAPWDLKPFLQSSGLEKIPDWK